MSVKDYFAMFPLILGYGIMYRDAGDRNAVFNENRWVITRWLEQTPLKYISFTEIHGNKPWTKDHAPVSGARRKLEKDEYDFRPIQM